MAKTDNAKDVDYSDLTAKELHEKAKDEGIAGASHMKKDELLEALTSDESANGARSEDDLKETQTDADESGSKKKPSAKRGESSDDGDDYHSMTVEELHAKAKEAGITGTSHMKKDELVAALGKGDHAQSKKPKDDESGEDESGNEKSSDGTDRKRDAKGHFEKADAAEGGAAKKTSSSK